MALSAPSARTWWATKIRQFARHLRARVTARELAELTGWLTLDQLRLFDSMHIADRRHGLDVVAALQSQGVDDPEVLLAGLLHDAGKGETGVSARVAYALGQAYGPRIRRVVRVLPPLRRPMQRLTAHAETSARLAAAAGCSARTVELIRNLDTPRDPVFGELLRLADEAN